MQLDQPLGAYEEERDAEAYYPIHWQNDEWPSGDHKFVNEMVKKHINA